jgi:hypothetical protein
MHCRLLTLLAALVLFAPGVSAQTWSAEQQELIDFANACWTTWETEDWDAYARACPADPELQYWDMSQSVPALGHDSWRKWAEAMWPRMNPFHHEIRPITIQIMGDMALYYFYANFNNEFADGSLAAFNHHELAVFQRRNGRWILVGGATMTFPVR